LVYTYKDVGPLLEEIRSNKVHKAESIGIYSLEAGFLDGLSPRLERTNKWGVVHQEGSLTVSIGEWSASTELVRHTP
jgi:hypothetical protein